MAQSTEVAAKNVDSPDWVIYVNRLRESVLEPYSSIMHGLSEGGQIGSFKNHVNAVLKLIQNIGDECRNYPPHGPNGKLVSNEVLRQACIVLLDMVLFFTCELISHLQRAPFSAEVINFAYDTGDQGSSEMLHP